jgi:hypothetical protein
MDFDALVKRRNALYMTLRYWRMHEKRNGQSEMTTKKLEQYQAEFEVVRLGLRNHYKREAEEKKAARVAELAAKEEERKKEQQIAENKRISNQCRTTRNRAAKWRPAPTVYYDTSAPPKEWNPSFTIDLS